jgi:hypothetical protein
MGMSRGTRKAGRHLSSTPTPSLPFALSGGVLPLISQPLTFAHMHHEFTQGRDGAPTFHSRPSLGITMCVHKREQLTIHRSEWRARAACRCWTRAGGTWSGRRCTTCPACCTWTCGGGKYRFSPPGGFTISVRTPAGRRTRPDGSFCSPDVGGSSCALRVCALSLGIRVAAMQTVLRP